MKHPYLMFLGDVQDQLAAKPVMVSFTGEKSGVLDNFVSRAVKLM